MNIENKELSKLSTKELLGLLRPAQTWSILAALIGVIIGGYFVGHKVAEISHSSSAANLNAKIRDLEDQLREAKEQGPIDSSRPDNILDDRPGLRNRLSLGWQLGRFEFIDGSIFPEAQKALPALKEELTQLLKQESFPADYASLESQTLIHRVLTQLAAEDLSKHAAVLIGIAAMRMNLIGASRNAESNEEMRELALSAIKEIDDSSFPQKLQFFDQLLESRPPSVPDLLTVIENHIKKGPRGKEQM